MGLAAVSAWFQEPFSALELGICSPNLSGMQESKLQTT
jgi:hypothetical protein